MELDPLFLSRLQFAFVIAFHILLPAFTVGLASFILLLEGLHLVKRDPVYLRLSVFWTRIFAVSFGMGVVSGIVMPFQFGTNWSRYTDATGNVLGPLFAYEGLIAFFLEAGFLGILLFGRKRVPPLAHFFSAAMVAAGTLFSSFWILAANSWMQTPTGYEMVDGRFVPASWLAVIFNPSFPYRLVHTVTGFYLTTAFAVLAVSAWHVKRGQHLQESRPALAMTVLFIAIFVPVQIIVGDLHGINTMHHQPVKLAAIEGLWDTQSHAPAVLFAIPDEAAERNRGEVSIPTLASYYLGHSADTVVKGLKEAPREDRPPVTPVFFAFRVMVGLGVLMLATAYWGMWLRWRGRLFASRAFHNVCMAMLPAGFIAVLAGWTVTEVGRQPWVVYGLMRTRDAVSPSLTGSDVLTSIALYVAVYLIVFGAGIFYMVRLARAGPPEHVDLREPNLDERPARPLSGARVDI
ncbi:MAG TPA: cytochrome ubiquinol oxidase subunit I [Casimicrobiaceae bacterium]|nr:cytochrome ubiquinol oxidase subunit I [Casimicrobiaceae bacterium]